MSYFTCFCLEIASQSSTIRFSHQNAFIQFLLYLVYIRPTFNSFLYYYILSADDDLIEFLMLRLGRSGGAMVLGKLPVPGRPTIWMIVGQGPIALAADADGVVWTFLFSSIFISSFSLSLGDGPI